MPPKRKNAAPRSIGAPFLRQIVTLPELVDATVYPFNIPAFAQGIDLNLRSKILLATHSPIILSYPGATLFSLDGNEIAQIDYRDTKHFQITRDFLSSPERFFRHLFKDDSADAGES